MRRFFLTALLALAIGSAATPAIAQSAPASRPVAVSTVGPWEVVLWGKGRHVSRCTLVRTDVPAGQASYGLLVDHDGALFSVETNAWSLPNFPVDAVVTPAPGAARTLIARPVSPHRANIDVTLNPDLLTHLQLTERATVRIGEVMVWLAFDDFNAARMVLEACVQKIGTVVTARSGQSR